MQEKQIRSLGREDPLEQEMATCSSILAWKIPWTDKLGGSMGLQRVRQDWMTERTHTHTHTHNNFTWQCDGLLRSFNGPEPCGLESTDKKVKERERGWYSLVYSESQLSPCTGLTLFKKASGALLMGWRHRAPSREGLRSPGRKVNPESLCTPRK